MASPEDEKKSALDLNTADARDSRSSEQDDGGVFEQAHKSGKLTNPLARLTKEQLLHEARQFAAEKGLQDEVDVIERGALVAQNPVDFQSIEELSQEEKDRLQHESEHKWSHPFLLYLTIFTCSIGAATQGWDQTGSNGANLSFPQEFGISTETSDPNHEKNEWLVGLVNAAPYIASALVGCWLSDPLNNLFGRRGCIFLTALVLIATPIGSAFTHSWEALFVCRLIMGLGMGAKGSTVPVFAAENSPAAIRGALVLGWQLWTAFGIFLGSAANVIVADAGKIAWRLQLGSAFIPALPLAVLIYFCPESPRWLIKKGRYQDAYKSLVKLRHMKVQAARDLFYIHTLLKEEAKIVTGATYWSRFIELFTIPRNRRATIASSVVMLAQQMCGINIIALYSATIFAQSGFNTRQALYASLGFGAINFVFCFPALITIDTFGRRTLLLFTFPNMCWSLLVAGMGTLLPEGTARLGVVATFVYVFAAWYSPGEGPVPFTYSAEVHALSHREQGMSWAVTVCLGFASVLSITLPRMLFVMTPAGVFGFYAGLNMVAFVLIYFFVPETKQLTLEELDAVFSVSHSRFINHVMHEDTPYWFKKWILMQKPEKPRPLLELDSHLVGYGTTHAGKHGSKA
ncbi:unnamed protein product [Parajaminaea phylloscopi]